MEIKKLNSKATWPLRHKVMWPNKPIEYVQLPNDQEGLHLGLFIEEKLVSVISVFVENGEAQFRKFATDMEEQGKGYGTKLLTYLLDYLKQEGVKKVWCNARVEKAFFYNRFGLKETEQRFSKGGIDYVIMEQVFE
ncbi:GNAT family N-acetyltransferase [Algivirga pacifica]|uniref:GNAT family N-acetyltransferase n=1 Tax=Algivirga pacifica TaxID=1162670 RepID=A0ABP9DFH4_9BACT